MAKTAPFSPSANTLDFKIDFGTTLDFLRLGAKRLDYGLVNAVNTTAKAVQAAERARARAVFHIRRDFVINNVAVIKPFANVSARRFYATVAIGVKPRLFLAAFETGGARPDTGRRGGKSAIPVVGTIARPSISSAQEFPSLLRRLGFKRQRATSASRRKRAKTGAGGYVQEGAQNTFMTAVGVFQRYGAKAVRAIYIFGRPKLGAVLHWHSTARSTALATFPKALSAEVASAIAYKAGGAR